MPYNSTIIPKKKKLKCGCFDYNFSKGRCKMHATIEDTKKRMDKQRINEQPQPKNKSVPNKTELDKWFEITVTFMTGKCANCGGRTCKGDIKYQKFSQSHIFAKNEKAFPSIAANELNFVELCYFNESCHSNFDNNGYEYAKNKMPKLWKIIVERAKFLYPLLTQEEKARFPDVVLKNISIEI